MMKVLLGLSLILLGAVLGLYVGVWVMFVGGIVDIVNAVKLPDVPAMGVAIGAAKIVCAGLVGWLAGILPIIFGAAILQD